MPNRAHTTVEQNVSLQVQVTSYKTFDTAFDSLQADSPQKEGPTAAANRLLDKLLAQTATMHQKLDGLTQSGQVIHQEEATTPSTRLTRGIASPLAETPSPYAILDSCLDQARKLHLKMDKLSAEMTANKDLGQLALPADADQPGGQESSDKVSSLEPARSRDTRQPHAVVAQSSSIVLGEDQPLDNTRKLQDLQVKVDKLESLDTAAGSPPGISEVEGDGAEPFDANNWLNDGLGSTKHQHAGSSSIHDALQRPVLQVKVKELGNLDTAVNSPQGPLEDVGFLTGVAQSQPAAQPAITGAERDDDDLSLEHMLDMLDASDGDVDLTCTAKVEGDDHEPPDDDSW